MSCSGDWFSFPIRNPSNNMAVAYEKISWVASLLVLLLGFASCSSQGGGEFTHRSLNFWKAARARVPPTGPNTGTSRKFNFGTLPKGTLIPPSWPSKRTSRPPPPPPHPSNFGTLPKYTPIPPSGPSGRTSSPPPPHPFNFRMQYSGPSHGPPRYEIPPPPAF